MMENVTFQPKYHIVQSTICLFNIVLLIMLGRSIPHMSIHPITPQGFELGIAPPSTLATMTYAVGLDA